jgi:hypothetical protein
MDALFLLDVRDFNVRKSPTLFFENLDSVIFALEGLDIVHLALMLGRFKQTSFIVGAVSRPSTGVAHCDV